MRLKNFSIDKSFLTSVTTHKVVYTRNNNELTKKDLFDTLKEKNIMKITGTEDHPVFDKLRNELGEKGYISIERGWWNGDRVLKPFKLNNKIFRKDERFPCAGAQGLELIIERQRELMSKLMSKYIDK